MLIQVRPQRGGLGGSSIRDEFFGRDRQLVADALKNDILTDLVEDDLRAGRQEREPSFQLATDAGAAGTCERPKPPIKPELFALHAYEVERGEDGF